MKILVTGGAGYIGSVLVDKLVKQGHQVVVFDNLIYGHEKAVRCPLVIGDLSNREYLLNSLKDYEFETVIHLANYALSGESMTQPDKYFSNNISGGINLLEYMTRHSIKNLIFSSSCSVYGSPKVLPVDEKSPFDANGIYGETKVIFENILSWYAKVGAIKYISLRYFNAAGASLDGRLGESHIPETHLIPLAIAAVTSGKSLKIYGKDYPTPDGTCLRDYVHVEDLAEAHLLALKKIVKLNKSEIYNLGSGQPCSNLEVAKMVEKVSGKKLKVIYGPRRAGDASAIYADFTKAKKELGYQPKHSDLKTIVKTALIWHLNPQY